MDPSTGVFTTMDTYQGSIFDPVSLHKYLYANANPVTYVDPSGYMATHQDLEAGMAGSSEIDKAQASHSSFAIKVFKNLMKKVGSGVAGGLLAVADQRLAGVTDRDQLALAFRNGFLVGFAFSFATGELAMALGYSGLFVGAGLAIQSFREGNFWQGIYRLTLVAVGGFGLYKSHLNSKVPENTNTVTDKTSASNYSANKASFDSRGYHPEPGERTFNGYVKKNVNIETEIVLRTKSPGFNNNANGVGGQFKRIGAGEHGTISPHVHQPIRNDAGNGYIYGSTGSKTQNGGVTYPSRRDITQLYEYLENGKYH